MIMVLAENVGGELPLMMAPVVTDNVVQPQGK